MFHPSHGFQMFSALIYFKLLQIVSGHDKMDPGKLPAKVRHNLVRSFFQPWPMILESGPAVLSRGIQFSSGLRFKSKT
jgi:hypothetical protein